MSKSSLFKSGDSVTIPEEFVLHVCSILTGTKPVSIDPPAFDFVSIVKAISNNLGSMKAYGWSVKRDIRDVHGRTTQLFREIFGMSRQNLAIAGRYGAWMATVNKNDKLISADQTNVPMPRQLYQAGSCDYLVRSVCIGVMYAWVHHMQIRIKSRSRGVLTINKITIEAGSVTASRKSGFRNPLVVVCRKKQGGDLDYQGSFPLLDSSRDPVYGHAWLRLETHEGITLWAELTPAQFGMADEDIAVRFDGDHVDGFTYDKDCEVFYMKECGAVGGDVEGFLNIYKTQLKSLDLGSINAKKYLDGSVVLRK